MNQSIRPSTDTGLTAIFGETAPCIASYSLQFSQPYGKKRLISIAYIALYSLYSLYSYVFSYARQSPHLLLVPIRGIHTRVRTSEAIQAIQAIRTSLSRCFCCIISVRVSFFSAVQTKSSAVQIAFRRRSPKTAVCSSMQPFAHFGAIRRKRREGPSKETPYMPISAISQSVSKVM